MEGDFEAVIAGELRLLDPDVRRDGEAVRALLHDDFREFGASGTVWYRGSVARVTADTAERVTADDLHPVRLGPDAVLLTYTARWRGASSLRTSVWVRTDSAWLLLHHQGTRLPE